MVRVAHPPIMMMRVHTVVIPRMAPTIRTARATQARIARTLLMVVINKLVSFFLNLFNIFRRKVLCGLDCQVFIVQAIRSLINISFVLFLFVSIPFLIID